MLLQVPEHVLVVALVDAKFEVAGVQVLVLRLDLFGTTLQNAHHLVSVVNATLTVQIQDSVVSLCLSLSKLL